MYYISIVMAYRNLSRLVLTFVAGLLASVGLFAQKHLPGADFSALNEDNHPRLFYTPDEFAALKKEIKDGTNVNVKRLHKLTIEAADMAVNDTSKLRFVKDVSNKRILHISSRAENRLIPCAYAYRMTGKKWYLRKAEKDLIDV